MVPGIEAIKAKHSGNLPHSTVGANGPGGQSGLGGKGRAAARQRVIEKLQAVLAQKISPSST